jgi:hypothetical protein
MAYGGKVWQVIDEQLMNNETMLNVYFYKNDAGVGNAEDVAQAFHEDMLFVVPTMQSADIQHISLKVQALFALDDNFELATGDVGTIGTEAFPSASAINFTLRPLSRAVRPGSKRIAGIPENAGNHNVVNNAGYLTAVENVRLQMEQGIEFGLTPLATYDPCIVKRIPYTAPSGRPAYRLPTTGAEAFVFGVSGALVSLTMSHQVSRGN